MIFHNSNHGVPIMDQRYYLSKPAAIQGKGNPPGLLKIVQVFPFFLLNSADPCFSTVFCGFFILTLDNMHVFSIMIAKFS